MATYRGGEAPDHAPRDVSGPPLPGMENVEEELNLPPEAGTERTRRPGEKGYMREKHMAEGRTHDDYPARQNPDGSHSSEVSVTVNHPDLNRGQWTNIPSLWEGKEVDEDEAVERVNRTERKYPSFGTVEEAEAAAMARSNEGGAGQVDRGYSTYNTRDAVTNSYQQGGMVQSGCKHGSSTVITCTTKNKGG